MRRTLCPFSLFISFHLLPSTLAILSYRSHPSFLHLFSLPISFLFHYRSSKSIFSLVLLLSPIAPNRILIDIPSTLHLDRLQHQEAQTRSQEYLTVLNTVKLPQQTIRKLYSMTSVTTPHNHSNGDLQVPDHDSVKRGSGSSASSGHSVKAPSVRDVLAEKAIDAKTLGWVSFHVPLSVCHV